VKALLRAVRHRRIDSMKGAGTGKRMDKGNSLSAARLRTGRRKMPCSAKVSPQSSNRKLILCIDDYKQGLRARRLILETAGYNVITASSGRIGLRLLEQHPVDLVVLDYRMPEMNGEAVACEIRRTHPHVPIVMLSGQIDVPKCASSAVDAFVTKGQPPKVLLQHLAVLSEGGPGRRPPGRVAGVL
jgi:CheY-like chemotaxis protein